MQTFRDLKETVMRRRADVARFMPASEPSSANIVKAMATPGTMAHALMISICAVLAEDALVRAAQAPEAHSRLSADTLDDEDPDVMIAARAIAEHGFGRNWDDFHSCDASQTDQGDLIEYGRAAVTALRSRVLPQGAGK